MPSPRNSRRLRMLLAALAILAGALRVRAAEVAEGTVLTNVAQIRLLSPETAAQRLPVRLTGVLTFIFDRGACFLQDETAGIYVGTGVELPNPAVGNYATVEGETSPGEYAPIVRPTAMTILGRTNLPPARQVSYEDLITGREDSQWVEVAGLVRAALPGPANSGLLEIATGGGRLVAFIPSLTQSNLAQLVDSRVRARGVCGTWFNRLRQLFGVRLMVPSLDEVLMEQPAATNAFAQAAVPIGKLMQFAPAASYGRRVKVSGTVVLQQPGRAVFVEDDGHGLYAQSRQQGALVPGDRVELLGFPSVGEYTPVLQDAIWRKTGSGAEPPPIPVWPDEALSGFHDCQLVQIEGRLLNRSQNNRETVLVLEADQQVFSAILESPRASQDLGDLKYHSRLRLTGVCRIEVGSDWQAGQAWRAKSFRILLRSPADVQVLAQPPWWTLTRLLWAVGILAAGGLAVLGWAGALRRRVAIQTEVIRKQLDTEAALKERYQDLFENANDVVYTTDHQGRLTSINTAGEHLFERSREALLRMRLTELIVEDQRPAAEQWLAQVCAGAAQPTVEWDFLTGQGQRVRLEISTRLIEHQGQKRELEGIARDVTEQRRLEKEILEASTREQRRIGHDLHDGVCQRLAAMAFLADTLADKLDEHKRPEAAEAHKLTALLNDTNRQTRGVARGLFPVRLEENGLVSALEELAANTSKFHEIRCEVDCPAPLNVCDSATAHHLYYIAQEAVLNAVRHGQATLVRVHLSAQDARCVLSVQDDGVGLPQNLARGPGMGIRIMQYRARMIGAELDVRRRQAGGTEVICRFPRPPEQ